MQTLKQEEMKPNFIKIAKATFCNNQRQPLHTCACTSPNTMTCVPWEGHTSPPHMHTRRRHRSGGPFQKTILRSNTRTERNVWSFPSSEKLQPKISLSPLDATAPQQSSHTRSLLMHSLHFSLQSVLLRLVSITCLKQTLWSRSLIKPPHC